jgi:hypothetical protein
MTQLQPSDFKALEPQAIEWLKAARYKLMRDLEQAILIFIFLPSYTSPRYYKLERARDTPMSQPAWALDPAQGIFLQPVPLPTVLNAYRPAIRENSSRSSKIVALTTAAVPPWIPAGCSSRSASQLR